MEIRRTSETAAGQIYLPVINTLLFVGVIAPSSASGSSSALSHAYGIAVTGTMVVSSLLAYVIVRRVWGPSRPVTMLIIAPILAIELTFLSANLLLFQGAYVPLLLGIGMMLIMWTWRRGNQIVQEKDPPRTMKLEDLLAMLKKSPPVRVPGTAVFLSNDIEVAPPPSSTTLKHNKVLHEKRDADGPSSPPPIPRIPEEQRAKVERIDDDVTGDPELRLHGDARNAARPRPVLKKQG